MKVESSAGRKAECLETPKVRNLAVRLVVWTEPPLVETMVVMLVGGRESWWAMSLVVKMALLKDKKLVGMKAGRWVD